LRSPHAESFTLKEISVSDDSDLLYARELEATTTGQARRGPRMAPAVLRRMPFNHRTQACLPSESPHREVGFFDASSP
jgi:hypothetical protein